MKAIIYYSLEGNTDYIARKIAEKTGADIIRLLPKKEYPTGDVSKYVWGGKSVVFGEKPKLMNKDIDLEKYDTIIIGTPIWASKFTPPINTFLHNYRLKDKNIFLFTCSAGGNTEKCFHKMKEILLGNQILGTVEFVDPMINPKNDTDEKVTGIADIINKNN